MRWICLFVVTACGGDDAPATIDAGVDARVVPGDFSCQGTAWGATAPDPLSLSGTVIDQDGHGVAGATVEIHDASTDALLAQGTSSSAVMARGRYAIDVPTGGIAPRVYRKTIAAGELDAYLYDAYPETRTVSLPTIVQSSAVIADYAQQLGVTQDPARGAVLVIVGDCSGALADGRLAGVTLDAPAGSTVAYVDEQGAPQASLTATTAIGQILVLDAPPGELALSLHAGAVAFRTWPIDVRAGAFTASFRYP